MNNEAASPLHVMLPSDCWGPAIILRRLLHCGPLPDELMALVEHLTQRDPSEPQLRLSRAWVQIACTPIGLELLSQWPECARLTSAHYCVASHASLQSRIICRLASCSDR